MFITIEGGGNIMAEFFTSIEDDPWYGTRKNMAIAEQEYADTLNKYSGEAGQKLAKENAAQLAQNQMAAAQSAAQSSARTSGMGKAASAALGGQAGGQAYSQNFQQGYQTELARNQQAIENAKARYDEAVAKDNERYSRVLGAIPGLWSFLSDENLKILYKKIKES